MAAHPFPARPPHPHSPHAHADEPALFLGTAKPGAPWPTAGIGVQGFPELPVFKGQAESA